MITRLDGFDKNEPSTGEVGNYITNSEVLEHTLLQHYFLLKMRKAIGESVKEFWEDLDTYTTYQLLEWVHEVISIEEDIRNNPEKHKNKGSESVIEEDPEAVDLYNQMRR